MRIAAAFFLACAPLLFAAEAPLDALTRTAAQTQDAALQLNILRGMNAALKGKSNLPAPRGWVEFYEKLSRSANAELRQQAQMLSVIFGGGEALADLRRVIADRAASAETRRAALDSLVSARDQPALPGILALLGEPGPLRAGALRGLAQYNNPEIAGAILGAYGKLASDEKRDAIAALAMRPASAHALLAAVDRGGVQRTDLSAPVARQLQDLKDPAIDTWLAKNWGAVRTTSAEKQKEIARYKAFLTPQVMAQGDPSHGRALYAQTCAVCHTLFGAGGKIGPELPGAFEDIDYLLQNILDPNAIIGKDYQQTVATTKGGQTVVGIVAAEDSSSVTLKSLAGPVILQRADIAQLTLLEISLMPEGLLAAMKENDVRDLFAYLRRHGPVPMLASAANVNDFFTGVDLAHWTLSSAKHWEVKNGAIIGRGSADRAEFITSDLTAENFRLRAELSLSGAAAVAEIALRGANAEGGFNGLALRLTSGKLALVRYAKPGEPPEVIEERAFSAGQAPVAFTLSSRGEKLEVSAKSAEASWSKSLSEAAVGIRTNFHFQIAGRDAELRITGLSLALE